MADETIEAEILVNMRKESYFFHYLLSDDGTVYVAGHVGLGEWVARKARTAIQEAMEALLQNRRVEISDQVESHWLEADVERNGERYAVQLNKQVTGRRLLAVSAREPSDR